MDDRIKRASPQKVGLEDVVELKCGLRHVICRRVRREEGGRRREEGGRRREEEGSKREVEGRRMEDGMKREDGRRKEDGKREVDDRRRDEKEEEEEERKEEKEEEEEEEEEGEVYVWGERMAVIGEKKVLDRFGNVVNYQNLSINQFKPRKVSGVEGAIRIETGGRHNVILTSKEEVYVFGDNEYGQLGLDPIEFRAITQPVKLNRIIEDLLLKNLEEGSKRMEEEGRRKEGRRKEEEERREEKERRDIKEDGGQEKEEVGIREKGGTEKEKRIREIQTKRIQDIALGLTFTLILSVQGNVFILGVDKSSPSCQPHMLRRIIFEPKINEISASGFKWIALDKKGGVYEREGDKLWYLDRFEEGHVVEVKAGLEMSVCLVGF